ncbi:4169_t:CDS:1 [Paraglomus occultum]|uniref:4169_t:CDS:1 n=1 Tax=Paraglomus occultum TaxID=144539 RepID=A0A9N9BLW2_9GLOM|nr:4169_t:CDS:1 [Paraglomus occultum]
MSKGTPDKALAAFTNYTEADDKTKVIENFVKQRYPHWRDLSNAEYEPLQDTRLKTELAPYLEGKELEKVMEAIKKYRMTALQNDERFSSYLTLLFRVDRWEVAELLYKDFKKYGDLGEKDYGILLAGFLQCNKYDIAIEIWDDYIAKNKPTQIIYTIVLDGFSKRTDLTFAERVWERMKSDGIEPDSIAYAAMIEAYFRARNPARAAELFEELNGLRVKLDVVFYNRIINGMCWCMKIKEAMKIYAKMKSNPELEPNLVTYNTLLRGALFAKEYAAAAMLMGDMRARQMSFDTVTLTTYIDRMLSVRDIDAAKKLWDLFRTLGLKPNNVSYGALIGGLIRCGDDAGAQMKFKEMIEARIKPGVQVYTNMIQAFFYRGFVHMAEEMYQRMRQAKVNPTTATYNIMIGGFLEANNVEKAIKVYEEMIASRTKPNQATYNALLGGLVHKKMMDLASVIYDDMIAAKFLPERPDLKRSCEMIKDWRASQTLRLNAG